MNVALNNGAGRARSAIPAEEIDQATLPLGGRSKKAPLWSPVPVSDPSEVDWGHPMLRVYIGNLLDMEGGPFADVDGDARVMLKSLLHCRNPRTGDCTPSWPRLGRSASQGERNVGYILSRLLAKPSRQSTGEVVQGHGLIWRESRWRGARRMSTAYGFTCAFLVRAKLVLPHEASTSHNCMGCSNVPASRAATSLHGMQQNGDPSDPSGSLKPPQRGNRSRVPARRPPPAPFLSDKERGSEPEPDFSAFTVIFAREHALRYGPASDPGSVRKERQPVVATRVQEITAEACAWIEVPGSVVDRVATRDELCTRLVQLWLDWPGSDGHFLRDKQHPMGMLVGDLPQFSAQALAAWKRAHGRPSPELVQEVLEDLPAARPSQPTLSAAEVQQRAIELAQANQAAIANMRAQLGLDLPLPSKPPSKPIETARFDPDFDAFCTVFGREHEPKDIASLTPDQRADIGGCVRQMCAQAYFWAAQQGITLALADVRDDLCTKLVQLGLDASGDQPRTLLTLVHDLPGFGEEVIEAWIAEHRFEEADATEQADAPEEAPEEAAQGPELEDASTPPPDPDVEAVEALSTVFCREHALHETGEPGAFAGEQRPVVGAYLRELTGTACVWAMRRGIPAALPDIREALCTRLVRLWLGWPGSDGHSIRDQHHPMHMLVAYLPRFGGEALAQWKAEIAPPEHPNPEIRRSTRTRLALSKG